MKINQLFTYLLLFVLGGFEVVSQPFIQLDDKQDKYSSQNNIAVLVDEDNSLTLNEVKSNGYDQNFIPSSKKVLSFGVDEKTYWLRLRLRDIAYKTNWILWIDYPVLDILDVYTIGRGGHVDSLQTGFLRPFHSRKIQHSTFAIPLQFDDSHPLTIYIKVQSKKAKILPISVMSDLEFYRLRSRNDISYGIFFGLIAVMIAYNLFIFIGLREKPYLAYVFTILSTGLFFLGTSGYGFQYIWTESHELNSYILILFTCLILISASIFAQLFLETKKYSKVMHYGFYLIIALSVILGVASVFVENPMLVGKGLYYVLMADILLLLVSGTTIWLKGKKEAFYFTLAWLGYLVGGLLVVLVNLGVLPYNYALAHAAEFGAALLVILLGLSLSERYRLLKKTQERGAKKIMEMQRMAQEDLERKVIARTAQIQEANEELNQTVEELHVTNEKLATTNETLSLSNKKVTDSINYAQRIQAAILPFPDKISRYASEHFIFYKPRDIVSGDFYWFQEIEDKIIVIAADCTGHGVPGAFMSLLGTDALNHTILAQKITDASKILTYLDLDIQTVLQQEKTSIRDGIDMSLCIIDKNNHTVEFAGARNPLFYIQENELHVIKGDKFSIGGKSPRHIKRFTSTKIDVSKPTCLYLFSDGYPDQFGGENDRKFMIKRFKNELLENHTKPMSAQKKHLEKTLSDWMNGHRQIDDILVMGFRLEGKKS
ncbi:MAG: serine phosphatase RsbU (regulator of sigma subunit) [Flammeovirgaceae bacterium]